MSRFDYLAFERHLEELGARERETRQIFTSPLSQAYQRKQAFEIMALTVNHVNSLLIAFGLLTGDQEKKRYYKEFYDQARSEKGLKTKQ